MGETIKIEELTEEQIARLINEILQEPSKYKEEAKLLLTLSVWRRQGEAFVDEADYKIVFGEAEEIVLRRWNAGYPYPKGKDIALIPKSIPTVVVYEKIWDYETERGRAITVYVFTGSNWVAVSIQ
jgi:hypothetical protein